MVTLKRACNTRPRPASRRSSSSTQRIEGRRRAIASLTESSYQISYGGSEVVEAVRGADAFEIVPQGRSGGGRGCIVGMLELIDELIRGADGCQDIKPG